MCGIMGYAGARCAADTVLEGLERLAYRGYDSAGIATNSDGVDVRKKAGKIDALRELMSVKPLPLANCAIGHTRWATHGGVTDANSHPHGTSDVLIVHNGIIENYLILKQKLSALGYSFNSETDSEAAALLLDHFYKETGDAIAAIRKTVADIRGSFAILAVFRDIPNEIYCIRHESPLLIGIGENETFISSDIPAFLPYTRKYFRLTEGDIARVTLGGVEVYDKNGKKISVTVETATFSTEAAIKGGYEHFMRKEIAEEPEIINKLISIYTSNGLPDVKLPCEILRNISHITIVGCGTAYHAGLYGKTLLEQLARIRTDCCIASEFKYSDPILDENELVIFISQSGETADTLSSLRAVKARGARTLGIVNTVGSSIASESENTLYIHAGVEIAVASTKAYTAQCALLAIVALAIASARGTISEETTRKLIEKLEKLPAVIERCIELEASIKDAAKEICKAENLFYIGRRRDYAAAIEASLKLKEISYIHSEAYAAGELKHGTISLISEGTPVIAIFGDGDMMDKTLSGLKEVAARGAMTISIAPPNKHIAEVSDLVINLPEVEPEYAPLAVATVTQLLAYHTAALRGCDIDQPRNLAKSVTVE